VDGLLALSVLSAWLGALGFVRLRKALDRLHCVTFVNVAAGVSLALAVVVQDGATSRSWKTAALVLLTILAGAAAGHALGRAIYLRDGGRE
jgi:monovalent cation/proton antiporter MnhG/PhaG subunit